MGKIRIRLVSLILAALCLAGCAPATEPPQTVPETLPQATTVPPSETAAVSAPNETQPVAATEPSVPVDSYWTGVSWGTEEDGGVELFQPEIWSLDLLIRADGTARFRDIHEGISLTDDSLLELTWEQEHDGTYVFYCDICPDPVLWGTCKDGVLMLNYYNLPVAMEEKPLPQTVGTFHDPAELAGTWLMAFGETEGWEWEAMPANLDSMVIGVDYMDGNLSLTADVEERNRFGELEESAYSQKMTVLEEPLYPGCENERWSVRIGEESPTDANGYPREPELYATLLSYNTMLVQRYYTLDGAPAVSYQTYWRFPELVSWMDPEYIDLGYTNWVCTAYRDVDGNWGDVPEELERMELVLDEDGSCCLYPDGETPLKGIWSLHNGGVLLLDGGDDFWFGGAVTGYYRETGDGATDVYEMTLYYNWGLLRLQLSSYG